MRGIYVFLCSGCVLAGPLRWFYAAMCSFLLVGHAWARLSMRENHESYTSHWRA